MFTGEYYHSLDEKNRLTIPAKLRDELGSSFVLTKGLDNTLFIYKNEEWLKVASKINSLPFTKKDARTFTRFFMSGACTLETDRLGRILIPTNLKQFANINKECVIIGASSRLEVWSREAWNKFNLDNSETISEIAEHLFDFEIGGGNDAL